MRCGEYRDGRRAETTASRGPGPDTIGGMASLTEQWDALLADEPDDWAHLALELVLDDSERLEEAALLACALNPWHGATWRSGLLRFRVAHTQGYGAGAELTRAMLARLDVASIGGLLRLLGSLDAVLPVATQGPT